MRRNRQRAAKRNLLKKASIAKSSAKSSETHFTEKKAPIAKKSVKSSETHTTKKKISIVKNAAKVGETHSYKRESPHWGGPSI